MSTKSMKAVLRGILWAAGGSLVTLSVVYHSAIADFSATALESFAAQLKAENSAEEISSPEQTPAASLEDADLPTVPSEEIVEATPETPNAPTTTQPEDAPIASSSAPVSEDQLLPSDMRVVNGFSSSKEKEDFLSDYDDRIPKEFHVPADFKERVGFWFDIYTKYGSDAYVLHHSEYPWIIFRVVDVSHIMAMKTKNPWAPYHRSKAFLKKEKSRLAAQLLRIQQGRLTKGKTAEEKALISLISSLPKSVSRRGLSFREQRGQKDFFMSGLVNSSKYLHQMEEIFAKSNLPTELTRIPLVESSFNTNAVSKVGASGIWQFMPGIGSKFMHISDHIDERNSPLKATEAAARLLRQNWMIFKAWPLAITAYNHGAGNLLKAIHTLKTRDFGVIVRKNQNSAFGVASSNFYSGFLAALHAEKYQHEIFGDIAKSEPLTSDTIRLSYRVRTRRVADFTGMTMEELRLFNPDLKKNTLAENQYLPKGFRLHVPAGKASQVQLLELEAKNETSAPAPNPTRAQKKKMVASKKGRKLVKADFSRRAKVKVAESEGDEDPTVQ
ncbi:MAG: transglycosylase SLT domain-containing protein [Bdellovibrionales bacterium]|nr:transglycosylase SLT domain-containing protein [Bdellovibrionales bacterium]